MTTKETVSTLQVWNLLFSSENSAENPDVFSSIVEVQLAHTEPVL